MSCLKVIFFDVKKNPLSYAALFIAAIVCAVVTLFFVRVIRSSDSTPYDTRYSFAIVDLNGFEELSEFYDTVKYGGENQTQVDDTVIIGSIVEDGRAFEVDPKAGGFIGNCIFVYVGAQEEILYPELDGKYNVYAPKSYFKERPYGLGGEIGDTLNIFGSVYTVAGESRNGNFVISKSAPPKGLKYETLRPLELAFGRRLEQGELEYLSGLGFKNIPDANTPDYGFIAMTCLVALINIAFAAVISAKIIDNTIGGTARLRLLGGKRGAGAAVYAGTLNAIYIAGLVIALPIDGAISKWYKVYRSIDFGDALLWQDFAIVYGLLIAIYAAVSVGLAVKKTKNLAKNLKE